MVFGVISLMRPNQLQKTASHERMAMASVARNLFPVPLARAFILRSLCPRHRLRPAEIYFLCSGARMANALRASLALLP